MGKKDPHSSWVHAGKELEADVFVNLDTGETKHLGTKLTDGNAPKLYPSGPSRKGYVAGKVLQAFTGRTRRD